MPREVSPGHNLFAQYGVERSFGHYMQSIGDSFLRLDYAGRAHQQIAQ